MLVNSVNSFKSNYVSNSNIFRNNNYTTSLRTKNSVDTVSFSGGVRPEILRNQTKILLSQDVFAPKMKIKMPETALEKEVLLEILEQRLKLDKYVRLTNEKANINSELTQIEELYEQDINSKEADERISLLEKKGNIDSVLKTLNKQIEQEEKRNQSAINYFKEIARLREEYVDKKLIKYPQMEKIWYQIVKNNINSEEKYSTAELIEIIKTGKNIEVKKSVTVPHITSRKEFLATVEKEYEQLIRENINVYATEKENRELYGNQRSKTQNIRYQIQEKYAGLIKKFPGVEDSLNSVYSRLEKKYVYKVEQLVNTDIYPIGEIWDDMRTVEKGIKGLMVDLEHLKAQLESEPNNLELKAKITEKENLLKEFREDWIIGAKHSVNYESINRERMVEAGKIETYDYLISENKTLNRHKLALKIYNENENSIPEDKWVQILG